MASLAAAQRLHVFSIFNFCYFAMEMKRLKRTKVNLGFGRDPHCSYSQLFRPFLKILLGTYPKCIFATLFSVSPSHFCLIPPERSSLKHNTKLHLMGPFYVISSENKWVSKSLVVQTSGWHTDNRCCSSAEAEWGSGDGGGLITTVLITSQPTSHKGSPQRTQQGYF